MKPKRNLDKWTRSTRCLFSIALLLSAVSLHAQEAEEVFELSPFSVDGSDDTGYRANSTLAGTRLKSSLRDVGASISVATSEFMEDIGATDLETLLTYTGGTEVPGINGNMQASNLLENPGQVREERTNARPQANTRVRGLAQADLTTNLFITDAPFDNFNINRVTVNRGANAALFGLGSPGGVLDATYKRANFNNAIEVGARFDEFGTQRYTLDINRALVEDKLALRLMALDESIEWEQKQAYENDQRYHIDVLFQPTKSTSLRAYYTSGEIRAARPNLSPPSDYISSWNSVGQPLYSGVTDSYYASVADWQGGNPIDRAISNDIWQGQNNNPNVFGGGTITANGGRRMTVFFPDPNSSAPGGFNGTPQAMQTQITNQSGGEDGWPNGPTVQWKTPQEFRNILQWPIGSIQGAQGYPSDLASLYSRPQITDRGFYDYRENLYTTPSKLESGDIEAFNVSLEQTFLEGDLGFELAYDDQEYSDDLVKYNNLNAAYIDINLTLADGTANPNVGRAYVGGDGFAEPQFTSRKTKRATGFYRFNFAEKSDGWASKLGEHTLTLNGSNSEILFNQQTHMSVTSDPAEWNLFTEGRSGQNVGGLNRTQVISYTSDSLIGVTDPSQFNIGGVNVIQEIPSTLTDVLAWDAAAANAFTFTDPQNRDNIQEKLNIMARGTQNFSARNHVTDPANTWTWGGRGSFSEVDSAVAILQSKFANGNIVGTASWRQDDVEIFDFGTTGATGGLHSGFADLPSTPGLQIDSKKTTGYSVVAHSPQFINNKLPDGWDASLHFNVSKNFVATGTRLDIFGDRIPQQAGDTKEMGFSIRGPKVDLKMTYYESSQVGADVNPVGRMNNIWRDILNNNTPAEIAASGITTPPSGFLSAFEFATTGETSDITTRDINDVETVLTVDQWNSRNPQQNAIQTAVGSTNAHGTEIEMTLAPTTNWRIAINGTRATAVRNEVAAAEQMHLADRLAQWSNPAIGGNLWLNGSRQIVNRDDADVITSIEPNNDNLVFNPDTGELNSNILSQINTLARFTLFDGLPAPELREWRWNFITNYTFDDNAPSFLQGFGVGGALRWESPNFLGTGVRRDETGTLVQNADIQFEGSSSNKIDLWVTFKHRFERFGMNYRGRLGINNINSNDGLLPVASNPDGSIGVWRIEAPTTVSLTNTFSF